jgi:membrane-bound serine protease (ClpP class)
MKRYLYLLLAAVGVLCAPEPACFAAATNDMTAPVYVIPIKAEIERALVFAIRRGVAEAKRNHAGAIIFDMDTLGGRLDSCEDIMDIITGAGVPTYTYVNRKAISAGAIISMSTDHIYMAPGGRIGDAMPVMMSPLPMGGTVAIPDELKEKAVSPTAALIRSAAQRKGHDPNLAEAMVRKEIGYKIGDTVICETNRLLTLTNIEAEQLVGEDKHPLLSEGTVSDLNELMRKIGRGSAPLVEFTISPAEELAMVVDSFPYAGILLALGLLLIYIEFKIPGVILPGVAGVIILAIWFWGHNIAGLAGMGDIVLFIVGIALIGVEIFLFPGVGVIGVLGLFCMVAALLMAMVRRIPGGAWWQLRPEDIQESIMNLGLSFALTLAVAAVLAKFLPKTNAFQRIVLDASLDSSKGYQSSPPMDNLIGLHGIAVMQLHPGGIGLFDDKRLDVITHGEMIEQDTPIVIVETHGNRIVVEVAEKES